MGEVGGAWESIEKEAFKGGRDWRDVATSRRMLAAIRSQEGGVGRFS